MVDALPEEHFITIRYTNYRDEVSERTIVPQDIWFGDTKWHPTPQWLMTAIDIDKGLTRTFALQDMEFIK